MHAGAENTIAQPQEKITYNPNNAPVHTKYDSNLFYEKTDEDLALFYQVKRNTIVRVRKTFGIPKFNVVRDTKFLEYLQKKQKQNIKTISFKTVVEEFKLKIPKTHVLRIIVNNNLNIHFEDFPEGYKFPHGSRGYKNFGCRCDICVTSYQNLYFQRKIREAAEDGSYGEAL